MAPQHTLTGSGGERPERALNLITMLSVSPLYHTMVLVTSKPCGQQKFSHTIGHSEQLVATHELESAPTYISS